ncbi:sll0787 family AIR synthase-like protein [Variovorax ginsengisoli]|uniref:Sll0787 family AIR synthase-like protein n=1 Tax=Variovorax ginsengisoli TaxID=363844 RepID=A0ABT8SEQ6_9BURK|nr:sll0787 family AIR synthase-like protein [Variovorax ginsengisoli]MDN8618231.1 sll0787 family AIR synthase-like protein [Variovorax ginsengisoli]MDO1537401.1 sll0787 family AIR synthase-like protein [Variovorax ginsengisoli]
MSLSELSAALRASRGFAHKRDISDVVSALGRALPNGSADLGQAVPVGDDCAALPDGQGGYLLFAIEGLVEDFIVRMPWFAGYCGVMVNVSDIYAMGGRPVAVVNALWSAGMDPADQMLKGMAAAASRYGVPIVGGHSNNRSERPQLAVSILGRAKRLLTSFDARPGDSLLMAIDLRGAYEEPFPYWNASTSAPPDRLCGDLELLPQLAEDGLCDAAKDISMAGAVGTALMLLECSGVGATIDVDAIPRPNGAPLPRWLGAFPSFGFVLSVRPSHAAEVKRRFTARDIDCAVVGQVDDTRQLVLRRDSDHELLWDLNDDVFIREAAVAQGLHA